MKKQFVVEVTETIVKKVIIEAEDSDQAWDTAWDLYNHSFIYPDAGKDYLDTNIEVHGEPTESEKATLPVFTEEDLKDI